MFALLVRGHVYGVRNYFAQEQLWNPGFAVPWRQISTLIKSWEQPGDLLWTPERPFWRYYHGRMRDSDQDTVLRIAARKQPFNHRIWLVLRDRGTWELVEQGQQVRAQLLAQGARERTWNFLPRTPEDQRMLAWILRRPVGDAYVKVVLLVPPTK